MVPEYNFLLLSQLVKFAFPLFVLTTLAYSDDLYGTRLFCQNWLFVMSSIMTHIYMYLLIL